MMKKLRVLIVEDSEDDTLLLLRQLRQNGYDPEYASVDSPQTLEEALTGRAWDIVIADYSMPQFTAIDALRIVQEIDPDLPFIILSGTIGEDVAVAAMRAGAHDYIMKGNVARLIPAIERELEEAGVRRERALAEEALRHAQKMESLGLMAGGVAHDFNNLLVALMGQGSLALAKLSADSPARLHVEQCIAAARRAGDLTRQMLAYAGRAEFKLKPVDINELIEADIVLLGAAVPGSVSLETDLAKSLSKIEADPVQVQQVVMNLVINAAEALEGKAGTVTVRTRMVDSIGDGGLWTYLDKLPPGGEYVALAVEDTGIGMDIDTVRRIFDPFFTTKKTGTGLGLAAVLGIVRGHCGGLRIDSQVGKGTRLTVFFPALAERPVILQEQAAEVDLSDDLVLVIEDDDSVREAAEDILELQGIQVLSAGDGSAGLTLYQEQMEDIDLVLLDLTLPGMSGEETLRELKRMNPDVRVLLCSGYGLNEVASHLIDNGTVAFLQKPYDGDKLVEALSRQLDSTP